MTPALQRREKRAAAWLLAALLWAAGVAGEAGADDAPEVFTVRDVVVDEVAQDARRAQQAAIASAQRRAWRRLAARMVTAGAAPPAPPGDEALAALVQGLEFADERIAATRYRAAITVRFRADAVRARLKGAGIPHLPLPRPLLVVLPVLRGQDGDRLWGEDNPWLAAWQRHSGAEWAVEMVAPLADLDDLAAIDAAGALAGDWEAMRLLLRRYRADGALVAAARIEGARLQQTLTWHEGPQGRPVPLKGASAAGDWRGAVAAARRSVSGHWSTAALAPDGPVASVIVDIPLAGLAQWVDIRRRLESPAAVASVLPLVFSPAGARVRIAYRGGAAELRAALRQTGLGLAAGGEDSWAVLPP